MKSPRCPQCGGFAFTQEVSDGKLYRRHVGLQSAYAEDLGFKPLISAWTCSNCEYIVSKNTYLALDLAQFYSETRTNGQKSA